MKSAPELIAELQAEVERLERNNRSLISEQRSSVAEQREATKRALKPYADTERALWWLLAQVQSEPRPARHDDECWLRHLHCFGERLRIGGGPLAVAQELQWSRQRAADTRALDARADVRTT